MDKNSDDISNKPPNRDHSIEIALRVLDVKHASPFLRAKAEHLLRWALISEVTASKE